MTYLFTTESVSAGHPDKVCDCISDALLDLHLQYDSKAHTAIETMATTNRVIISGETAATKLPTPEEIEHCIRNSIKKIGYEQTGFDWHTLQIENYLHRQSIDISNGISNGGAGDQGIMFGYAKKDPGYDTQYMPIGIYLVNKLLQDLQNARQDGRIIGLEPDAKAQITIEYEQSKPVRTTTLLVSSQHQENLNTEDVREIILGQLAQSLPEEFIPSPQNILVNPAGRFTIGGPDGDTGLTGRKIVADTYGGYARHGGGAFSGKDPTKVDRSAAYALRHIAKNVVAAGLAKTCEIQAGYAIGVANPVSVTVNTFGTGTYSDEEIEEAILKVFDLRPYSIIRDLDLLRPIYKKTAAYGHFGRDDEDFTWERLDKTEELLKAIGTHAIM